MIYDKVIPKPLLKICSPLSPSISMHFILTVLLYIPYVTAWENLHANKNIFSLMNISFILMTCMFDQVVIL